MARRKPDARTTHQPGAVAGAASAASADALRVLVLQEPGLPPKPYAAALASRGICFETVTGLAETAAALARGSHDAVLIAADCFRDHLAHVLAMRPGAHCVVLTPRASLADAVDAMRAGAVDLVQEGEGGDRLVESVERALRLGRAERDRERRMERLKRICRRLNAARQQVTSQVDVLCNDLMGAYRELADQVTHVSLSHEFAAVVQQELDVESLLRTALEYLLTKTGPTNAAVFLPSNHTDFTLGAYVNYDCPRDAADVLLDHLTDVIAPRFQDETEVARFDTAEEVEERFGEHADWLSESRVIVFSCRHDGECLAVVTLFRDRATPFPSELPAQLKVMSDIFARQLARVIRIHHRHLPDKQWTGFDSWEEDDEDYGRDGGIAA